jgi:hypothetical protein
MTLSKNFCKRCKKEQESSYLLSANKLCPDCYNWVGSIQNEIEQKENESDEDFQIRLFAIKR